ncbi:SDR family NAD(P)-dependent oxidoreductase [Prevotella sp. OH937_COT-195]|uniref:SDR family NAD(P)-dependent oxidoreductase n=1 Tax=Prevotella sp. OH937_COT-195 TaxID=2491051 RepID=UPI000F653C75|nr:SDR family NAD(P)-dependent oxidoreductase [Prevotella sp. OH937_COT-195]RRD02011.1 SDR family NAD(P)-dependent oxidoreductase [Prevotella sp. OH937_COT-195]
MKRAVVIGASSGIGREVARLLLADGWHVGIAARRKELLSELEKEFPERVVVSCIDVTTDDAPQKILELFAELGDVGLFLHVSGIGTQNLMLDNETESATVATNVKGFTQIIDAVFNYMTEHQGGHIAIVSSIAGTKGLGVSPSYSASKAYQTTYIEALEQLSRMRDLNIRFTDLRPGFVDTASLDNSTAYPMLIKPEDVARQAVDAIYARKSVRIIDWRYSLLTFFWRLIPRWLWVRMRITNKNNR